MSDRRMLVLKPAALATQKTIAALLKRLGVKSEKMSLKNTMAR